MIPPDRPFLGRGRCSSAGVCQIRASHYPTCAKLDLLAYSKCLIQSLGLQDSDCKSDWNRPVPWRKKNILSSIAPVAGIMIAYSDCQLVVVGTFADDTALPQFGLRLGRRLRRQLRRGHGEHPPGSRSTVASGFLALIGRDAIRAIITADIACAKSAVLTMDIPEAGAVRVSRGLAYEAGIYSATDETGAKVGVRKRVGIFERSNDKCLFVRETWNSDIAPAEASAVIR